MMKKGYNVLDLFAGAGGFSSGFVNAGFKIKGAIEINEVFARTHALNNVHSTTIAGNIKDWPPLKFSRETGISDKEVNIIIGGPPCQTFSPIGSPKIRAISGDRTNEDPRNYLYQDYISYVKFYKPEVFVMENVPAMKTKYHGELFKNLLGEIEKIGYTPFHSVLNAVHYGVPQNRKRLFIIGFRNKVNYKFPLGTHKSPGEVDSPDLKPNVTVGQAITDLPNIYDGIRADELPYSRAALSDYQKLMRNGAKVVGNNVCRVSNERAKRVFAHMKQGDRYMDLKPEIRQILPFREDIFHDRLKRLSLNNPSWTVLAHIGMDGYMYIHPTEDRTLSVREAARLQSFSDHFKFVGNMREQYVQVGNSVPPLLAKSIAESIKSYII